jgi:hypothetical protein
LQLVEGSGAGAYRAAGGCPTSCVSGSGQSVSEVDFERE